MSMSDKYFEYLNRHIEIAPANSEEEVRAAQVIHDVFEADGFEVSIQDITAPDNKKLISGIEMAVFVLAVILGGIGGLPLAIIGLVLALLSAGLLIAPEMGFDLLAQFLPAARSQNVVALHKGTGPHAGRSVRPIVIVAHYDTGHEELLARPELSRFARYVYQYAPLGMVVAAACTLIQLIVALPGPLLRVIWVVGILAALPALGVAINNIAAHFMPLCDAANDNNAAVAAMMGVGEDVSLTDPAKRAERLAQLEVAAKIQAEERELEYTPGTYASDEGEAYDEVEELVSEPVHGVRHGKQVLEALGMLPASCEIVYEEPKQTVVKRRVAKAAPAAPAPRNILAIEAQEPEEPLVDETAETGQLKPLPAPAAEVPTTGEPTPRAAAPEPEPEAASTAQLEVLPKPEPEADSTAALPQQELAQAATPEEAPATQSASSTMPLPVQEVAPQAQDASWGQSSFTPQPQNFARRASLFDLPDPTQTTPDPLALEPTPRVHQTPIQAETFAEQPAAAGVSGPASGAVNMRAATPQAKPARTGRKNKKGEPQESMSDWLGVASDYDAKRDGERIGSWDKFNDQSWKGGAASANDEVSADDLKDAVLDMDYVDLVAHDIWFVAAGASELDHAGIKAFIAEHRKDLRGAFLINLDSIGAGTLTVLTEEGSTNKRAVDRRLLKMLDRISRDLHTPLEAQPRPWADTDATPAMRSSIRSATIMGCDASMEPALAHTAQNVADNVNVAQIADVNRIVSELIRRS